jgi:hypothetical protein
MRRKVWCVWMCTLWGPAWRFILHMTGYWEWMISYQFGSSDLKNVWGELNEIRIVECLPIYQKRDKADCTNIDTYCCYKLLTKYFWLFFPVKYKCRWKYCKIFNVNLDEAIDDGKKILHSSDCREVQIWRNSKNPLEDLFYLISHLVLYPYDSIMVGRIVFKCNV